MYKQKGSLYVMLDRHRMRKKLDRRTTKWGNTEYIRGSTAAHCLHNICTSNSQFYMASTTAPTSQNTPASLPPSVFTLAPTAQLEALYTIIRDKDTSRGDFLFYSDRIIRLLVEEGLNHLPVVPKTVQTPTVCDR